MKKFLKNIIFCFFVAFFLYPFLFVLSVELFPKRFLQNVNYLPASFGGFSNSRFSELENLDKVDVLFLGSSQTYRGFDTSYFNSELGVKSFNLGSSAQTHLQTNFLLNKHLARLSPILVVYEVYPEMFRNEGLESSLDMIANANHDKYLAKMVLKQNKWLAYNTYFYSFYDQVVKQSKYAENSTETERYIEGGYVEKEEGYNTEFDFKSSFWHYHTKQLNEFKKNISMLEENNIEFILVWSPLTSHYYNAFTNNSDHNELMKEFGTYYNFNLLIDLDDKNDFLDKNHLNKSGVKKFNEALLPIIRKYFQ